MKSLIVINLKTYQFGTEALKLAKIIEKVDKNIIVCAQASDLYRISKETRLKVYAQHVETESPGRNTGFILPEAAKANGAIGVCLNHSEHPLDFATIKATVLRCKELKLKVMLFAKNVVEAKKLEKLNPEYVIIEPPELVSGKISVAEAKPELIKKIRVALKGKFLVGAGIHSNKDVLISSKLGASGVALASAVTTAKNPRKVLEELLG
ncbi:MAG: triose-phosphate isomerase [Nanoarchaeota archaeon]|jgi:triosephosphate isomerase|nr:triose-phosphate isomerase [Nanoarchaeota archaeon]